jgi:hypothetical protein
MLPSTPRLSSMTLWTRYPDGLPLVADGKTLFTRRWAVLSLFIYRKNKNSVPRAEASVGRLLAKPLVRDCSNRGKNTSHWKRWQEKAQVGIDLFDQEEADS